MEATPTQIINYFSGFKQNLVPLFQRPYTWSERQWRTLWEDILAFYGRDDIEPRSSHFMGAVVTMPARSVPVGVSKFMVIDGQQRLTTLAALLCAIRDDLGTEDQILKRRIQNYYLTNDGFEEMDCFKLLPTQGDRLAYSALVLGPTTEGPESQFRKSYEFYRRRLKDRDDEGQPIEAKQILNILESRLMVVMINLSDNDDPYLIFESLNFKGSPLEQADLVRNYFLMKFPVTDQQAVYGDVWLPMQNRLGPNLTEFMRHFLGSEGEEVRKGDVYAAIKRLVSDSDASAIRLLMERMAHLSVFYSRIATLLPEANEDLGAFFARFRRLDFGTAYPLLLSLYEDYIDGQFGTQEFTESVRVLESYIVRRMVVGVPSNSLSGVFISLCKSKPVTDRPSAWLSSELGRESKNRRWPTDHEFHNSWLKSPLYGSRVCQVILECLEEQFAHHERVAFAEATIEHVMPQTLNPDWELVLGQDAMIVHSECLHTIGNLTLTGYNPELGNKGYPEKRSVFAASHFELNRYFAGCENWGGTQIKKRGDALYECALKLWPRPPIVPLDEPTTQQRPQPANFHVECVRGTQKHLGIQLSKLSQTRYEAGDHGTRLVCAVSAEHNEGGGTPYFWFAVTLRQVEFLESAPAGLLCFGCGSPTQTLLMPASALKPFFEQMSVTAGGDRHYWHVVIQRKNSRLILRLLGAADGPDVTQYLIPFQNHSASAHIATSSAS